MDMTEDEYSEQQEYDPEQHRENLHQFFDIADPKLKGCINSAFYTMSELGMLEGIKFHDDDLPILIWKIVEKMRTHKFPENLQV